MYFCQKMKSQTLCAALISEWKILCSLKSASPEILMHLMSLSWKPTPMSIPCKKVWMTESRFWLQLLPGRTWHQQRTGMARRRLLFIAPADASQHFTVKERAPPVHSTGLEATRLEQWDANRTGAMGCARYAPPLLGWKDQVSRYLTKTKPPAHYPAVPQGFCPPRVRGWVQTPATTPAEVHAGDTIFHRRIKPIFIKEP